MKSLDYLLIKKETKATDLEKLLTVKTESGDSSPVARSYLEKLLANLGVKGFNIDHYAGRHYTNLSTTFTTGPVSAYHLANTITGEGYLIIDTHGYDGTHYLIALRKKDNDDTYRPYAIRKTLVLIDTTKITKSDRELHSLLLENLMDSDTYNIVDEFHSVHDVLRAIDSVCEAYDLTRLTGTPQGNDLKNRLIVSWFSKGSSHVFLPKEYIVYFRTEFSYI